MYEFLAPWGVLAPAFCAMAAYLTATEYRRRLALAMIQAPRDARKLSGTLV